MAPRLVDPHPPRWRITEITLDVDAPIERAAEILIGPLVAGRYRLHKRTPTSLVLRLRGRAWWLLDDLTPLLGWLERRFGWKVGHLGHLDVDLVIMPTTLESGQTRLRVRVLTIEHDARLLIAHDLEASAQALAATEVLRGISAWQAIDATAEQLRRSSEKALRTRKGR